MSRFPLDPRTSPIVVVVGSGGVGKTTLAAAAAVAAAREGHRVLVMTFDPSRRLRQALGVGEEAAGGEVRVPLKADGELWASLLDARRTFDRLVKRYAPDEAARDRILTNRFYDHLSGALSGVLEYMAVERLFEVDAEGRFDLVVLDTPPTRQALDFLEAPDRIVTFLDSGAVRIALKPWFDSEGHLRPTTRLGLVGRNVEGLLDRLVGMELLRDMAEFFQAFAPMYAGFRERAEQVRALLRDAGTAFALVSGAGVDRTADTLFFARRLVDAGHHLRSVVVNRVHPPFTTEAEDQGAAILRWLADRDAEQVDRLRELLGSRYDPIVIPVLPAPPVGIDGLDAVAQHLR